MRRQLVGVDLRRCGPGRPGRRAPGPPRRRPARSTPRSPVGAQVGRVIVARVQRHRRDGRPGRPDQQRLAAALPGHRGQPLAVHRWTPPTPRRTRRRPAGRAPAARTPARSAARSRPPLTTSVGTSARRPHLGGQRGHVVAGEVEPARQQRLAVDQQPHPGHVDLGQREHHLRGQQLAARSGPGRRPGSGRRSARRPSSSSRSSAAARPAAAGRPRRPAARRTGRPAAAPAPAPPAPWPARWAGSAGRRPPAGAPGRRTRCAPCGSCRAGSTAAPRCRRAAGRSATARRSGPR